MLGILRLSGMAILLVISMGFEALAAEPVVYLDFSILRTRDNRGTTTYVDRAYLNRLVEAVNKRARNVNYKLGRAGSVRNDDLYYSNNVDYVLKRFEHRSKPGRVNIVYTRRDLSPTGKALITGKCCSSWNPDSLNMNIPANPKLNRYRYNPTIVMHSRYKKQSNWAVDMTAGVLLHEVGHQVGFHHNYKDGAYNAENYYKAWPLRKYNIVWAKRMQKFREESLTPSAGAIMAKVESNELEDFSADFKVDDSAKRSIASVTEAVEMTAIDSCDDHVHGGEEPSEKSSMESGKAVESASVDQESMQNFDAFMNKMLKDVLG